MNLPIDAEPEWGGTQPVKFPYILRGPDSADAKRKDAPFKSLYARLDKELARTIWPSANFPDVFDPAWVSNTRRLYAADSALITRSKSPYFIGAFSDDTDELSGFGPGADFPTDPPQRLTCIWDTWCW